MIANILSQFAKEEEENHLRSKLSQMYCYKINDDNIHPIYKPFKFHVNQIIHSILNKDHKEQEIIISEKNIDKEPWTVVKKIKLEKSGQILYKVNDKTREVQVLFDKNKPKYYIRNKIYSESFCDNDKDESKMLENKFIFQKFGQTFKFKEFLSDAEDKNENNIIKSLRQFEFIIKNEKYYEFLNNYHCLKHQDEIEIENLKNIMNSNFSSDYVLKKKYRDISNFTTNLQFICERIQDVLDEFISNNDKNDELEREDRNQKNDNSREKRKTDQTIRRILEDGAKSEILGEYMFKLSIKYQLHTKFDKKLEAYSKNSKNFSIDDAKVLYSYSIFMSIMYYLIYKFKVLEEETEDYNNLLNCLIKTFRRTTEDCFSLFSDNVHPFIVNETEFNTRFPEKVPSDDTENENYFDVSDLNNVFQRLVNVFESYPKLHKYLKELQLLDPENLKLELSETIKLNNNCSQDNESDMMDPQINEDDYRFKEKLLKLFYEKIIYLYTLEGPLSKIVNSYFNGYEDAKLELSKAELSHDGNKVIYEDFFFYIFLLFKALAAHEKDSTDCVLYKVITLKKSDFEKFGSFSKGTKLFNRQFLNVTSDIQEATKYIYSDNFNNKNNEENEKKEKKYQLILEIETRKERSYLSPIVTDIKHFSAFPFENEFIFCPYNVFNVKNKVVHKEDLISIKLSLLPNYFRDLKTLGRYRDYKESNNETENTAKNLFLDIQDYQESKEITTRTNADLKTEDNREDSKLKNYSDVIKSTQKFLQELIFKNQNSLISLENHEQIFIEELNSKILKYTPNLTKLNLSNNNLVKLNLHTLAEKGLQNKKHLKSIVLKKNSIKEITNFITFLINNKIQKINEIDFSYNRLNLHCVRDLVRLMKTVNLMKIDLSYNKINSEGARLLAEKFNETPNLQYLDLSNNNLYSLDYEFEHQLKKNLKLVKCLNTLKLQGCNLTSQSVKLISENLFECKNLEIINFSCNLIDEHDYDGSVSISSNFDKILKLKSLNLGYNYIGMKGIGGLKSLFSNFRHLINLEFFSLNGNIISSCYDVIFSSLKYLKNLVELDFNELQIGDDGLKYLSKSFIYLGSLEKLSINNNNITPKGMELIDFKHLKSLKDLNISNNKIKAEGCEALKTLNFEVLERLNLWSNELGCEGVFKLIESIYNKEGCEQEIHEGNKISLKEINISQNNIDDKEKTGKSEGLEKILKSLLILPRMKIINFSANYLNESSFKKLIAFYPSIRSRRIIFNISDCPSHSDLNNTVKGEFEKMCKEDNLVIYSS